MENDSTAAIVCLHAIAAGRDDHHHAKAEQNSRQQHADRAPPPVQGHRHCRDRPLVRARRRAFALVSEWSKAAPPRFTVSPEPLG